MSKIKLSFSFLLTLMLVAMFSIVASAAETTQPTAPGQNELVDNLPKTAQEELDKNIDNGVNNVNNSGVGAEGQTANFSDVIKSDDMSTGNTNGAHKTQRTHGEYQNNTNSCASCHQTHTGASKNLLFKNGEYATCTACHDGTLGFYNVFTGSDSAGSFGGTHDGNMSVHLANGTVEVKAAPGGNQNPDADAESHEAVWTAEFTCASCHAPHGSFGDRLLHPNPNHMGNLPASEGGKKVTDVPVVDDIATATTDYVLHRFTLDATTAAKTEYSSKGLVAGDIVVHLKKKNVNATTGVVTYVAETDPWLHGYGWDDAHTTKFYWSTLYNSTGGQTIHTDSLKTGAVLGNGYIAAKAGTAAATAAGNSVKGNVARSYVVNLVKGTADVNNVFTTDVKGLWTNAGGKGVKMSNWCASCHTDYLASSSKQTAENGGEGIYSHAYRHTTTSDTYTCVRCHYAHGTDVTIMRDAQGKQVADIVADSSYFTGVTDPAERLAVAKDYMLDKNPSSALKRYTNMAVCWGCHTSSHSEGTRNSSTYEYNSGSGATKDHNGLSSTGGVTGF